MAQTRARSAARWLELFGNLITKRRRPSPALTQPTGRDDQLFATDSHAVQFKREACFILRPPQQLRYAI